MPSSILPIVAATFLLLGGLICAGNAWWAIQVALRGSRASAVPLLGAVFLGLGLVLLPATRPWCWVAVLVDAGTLQFLRYLPSLLRERRRTSAAQLLADFRTVDGERRISLRLFRTGVFVLRLDRALPPGTLGLTQRNDTGTWQRAGDRLRLESTSGESATLEFAPAPDGEVAAVREGFPTWDQEPATRLAGLRLVASDLRTA
jgi:hypothetical protein